MQRASVLAASTGALAVVTSDPAAATVAATNAQTTTAPPRVQVVYLQGSAHGPQPKGTAITRPLHWVRWSGRRAITRSGDGLRDVRVLELRRGVAGPGFARLDVLSRHTVTGVREPVEFFAWSYIRDGAGRNSAPVSFVAQASGNAELLVDYRMQGPGVANAAGRMVLPVGSPGLRDGVYALLSPRATDGSLPDPRSLVATGDPDHPLACADGSAPDFDHLVISIAPAVG